MGQFTMKPFCRCSYTVKINNRQIGQGPKRYYWQAELSARLEKTYLHDLTQVTLVQKGDSPTIQHCVGMWKRFAALNSITKYRIEHVF